MDSLSVSFRLVGLTHLARTKTQYWQYDILSLAVIKTTVKIGHIQTDMLSHWDNRHEAIQ